MTEPENLKTKTRIKPKELWNIVAWSMKIYLHVDKKLAITNLVLDFIGSFDGIVYAFLFAKTLDAVVNEAQSQNPSFSNILNPVLLVIGSMVLFRMINLTLQYTQYKYNLKFNTEIEIIMANKLMELGIQNLENPEISNKINRANNALGSISNFIQNVVALINEILMTLSKTFIVLTVSPILLIMYLLLSIPVYLVDKKYRAKMWGFGIEQTENRRKSGNVLAFLSSPSYLEEVLITGGGKFLLGKFTNYFNWYNEARTEILKNWNFATFFVRTMKITSGLVSMYIIFTSYLAKMITLGTVTFQIEVIRSFQSNTDGIMKSINAIFELALSIKDVQELLTAKSLTPDGGTTFPKLTKGPEIKLEDVTFSYPNAEKNIFTNLNLNIKSGEKIAIVGHNGAGKTTLTKLILRYYKLQKGKITINGFNLDELLINTYYRNVGLLSQEYNAYGTLSVKENVLIGQSNEEFDEVRFIEALKNAEAEDFVSKLPKGPEQILSERFKDGVKISTGQWQKLALARFFYRNSPLVIFDEPTSSIDAVSEYNIFNKIYSFFRDKTVIIISHRFSTVRNADRIIVVDNGNIIEEGTHMELMNLNGKYAESFLLQAEGYTTSIA